MDGNRGAKGSIKDRLISMLYRLRYKKKQLKEEDYKIENKEKQINYLNNLINFKEYENINTLDSKDINALDKVKFNAIYNVRTKKGFALDKLSDNEIVDANLSGIELKTSELDEKVELKKEVKKTKSEVTILKEVDDFVKKAKDSIDEIREDIDVLKEESKQKNKDTKKLEEKYEQLRQKVEKLKKQFDAVKYKYDFSDFRILESIKLVDNIKDYKSVANLNEMDMMLKVCKNEFEKIKEVKVLYVEQKTIGSNILETKKEQKNIKIKFVKSEEKYNELNNIHKEINEELKHQQEIVDEMYSKASFLQKKVNKKLEYVGKTKMLSSIFKIAGGILTLPFTGVNLFGKALGTTLINKGLKQLNKSFETREKIEIEYDYEDISKQISEVEDKVGYVNLVLSDSLNEMKKLKSNFTNTYKEYKDILPNYYSTLEKIEILEVKLLEEQEKISKINNKLSKEKEINKQKMKKIGEK